MAAIKLFILTILALCLSQTAFANNHKIITNYYDLSSALSQGDTVRAIMTINKCVPASKNSQEPDDTLGSLNFTNFNQYKIQANGQMKNVIATSINMLTQSSKFGPVYNYVRLHVFEDGSAEIFSEYLDPKNFAPVQTVTLNCHLSNGADQNAIKLYNLSS